MLNVTYLAHDLDDPSIWRRVAMLETGGARVSVAGFRRGRGELAGPATVLGRTRNRRMARRAASVAAALPVIARRLGVTPAPDVILARNLEMLMLGGALQRRHPGAALVYELLDIHGLMLGQGATSRALRGLEARLMGRCSQVIVSSPAFVRNYLEPFGLPPLPVMVVENRMLRTAAPEEVGPPPAGPAMPGVISIGWFGMLRCRWSLHALDALTREDPGRYRVRLRGRPALDAVPEFYAIVSANPDLSHGGEYAWPDELATIYHDVDLAWMIDRYQAGQNSDWLLPNRLYEGGRHGAIPVALAGTEVARRTRALGIGLQVPLPRLESVQSCLSPLDPDAIAALRGAVTKLPRETWETGASDCRKLVDALALLRPAGRGAPLAAEPAPTEERT